MLVTSVYLQVSTEDAMLMQIRAHRDLDLQRDRLVQKLELSPCHAEQMKHSRELSSVLSRTILGSTLVSVSLSALGILTFSVFFTLFVSSIKVSVSFTYHFISSSPNETSLFFTTSIELLIIFSPL